MTIKPELVEYVRTTVRGDREDALYDVELDALLTEAVGLASREV
jgi:hypothetical protein